MFNSARFRRSWLATTGALLIGTAVLPSPAFSAGRPPALAPTAAAAAGKGAVGWDGYRQLYQLPYLSNGVRTWQQSSFDRSGGNDDHFHVLATASDGAVIAEHRGPGEVDSIWTTGNFGGAGNLKIVLDGQVVVNAPLDDVVNGRLGAPFVFPLVANDAQSSGGLSVDVPMPFRQSMRITTDADPEYYHVTYRTFPDAVGVSTFSAAETATDVLTTMQESGTRDPKPTVSGAVTQRGSYQLMPGQSATVAQASGSGQVTGLRLRIPHLAHPGGTPLADDGLAFAGNGGRSSFTVALHPTNTGIRIVRRYDPAIGNQKADVTVNGVAVGRWSSGPAVTAGSWADETIAVPASVTAGRSQVSVTNSFVGSDLDFNEFMYTIWEQVGGVWQRADTVDVGPNHAQTAAAHGYTVGGQTWSGARTFTYPVSGPVSDDGRAFGAGGSSTFTVGVDPANSGVRLTRRIDPSVGAQVAAVTVDGQPAGSWAANPTQGGDLWADESIELPASVTAGKSRITVRNVFTSSSNDFNEFTYWADSHVPGGLARSDTLDVGNGASEAAHGYGITAPTWGGSRTFSYPATDDALTAARIRISFDGTQTVDAPLGQFFGAAMGAFDTRSLMSSVDIGTGELSAWWPMPYGTSVSVSLVNGSGAPLAGEVAMTTAADSQWQTGLASGAVGYFHATSRAGATSPGQDWKFLQTTGHGKVVAVVHGMSGPTTRRYLEGDERVYADGSASPQVHGTGTEDFYQGAWYFINGVFSNPLTGETSNESAAGTCPADTDCTGVYRLMLTDPVSYSSSLDFGIEHGDVNDIEATYASTTLWYGQSAVTARQSDSLTIGNTASEQAHWYSSGNPGSVTSLAATYEGNDGTPVTYTRTTRATTASLTFTMAIQSSNSGVVLQRTSDQNSAYQAANLMVDGVAIGQWSQPLGNTWHRWLDDEYTLPASVTAGKSRITITLTPTSGAPAWSAASYRTVSLTP